MKTEKTIVIADDDSDLVKALSKRCENLGLRVRTAFDALDALNIIHESEPDLICLDVTMPCGDGLSVMQMLASDEYFRSKPVIIMTGNANEETIRRCHSHRAYYVEKCADVWPRIEPLICELLEINGQQSDGKPNPGIERVERQADLPPSNILVDTVFEMLGADPHFLDLKAQSAAEDEESPWVLCIDDDADFSYPLKVRLERYGIAVVRAFEGMEGVRFACTRPADVILLDYEMPNGQGDYVLRRLKDNPLTKDIPVIMITGRKDRMLERRILNMGAAKFMNKPPVFDELLDELRKHIDILPRPIPS